MREKSPERIKQGFLKYYFSKDRNIFKWFIKVIISLFNSGDILFAKGSHIITAYPGGGKTLLANHIVNEIDPEKYFILSNMKEFEFCDAFKIEDIFCDSKQVKSFPTTDERGRKLYAVIFDEINLSFNKRINKKSSYNDIFVGLIEFLVSHRHQDIPRVYFLGQKLELQDTQLQSLFKFHHDIYKAKRFPKYWFYKDKGYIDYIPYKLKILNRVKSIDDEFIEVSKSKVKIKMRDLLTYDTKFLGNSYKQLENVKLQKK